MSVTANYCNIFCLYVCFDGSLGNKGAVGVSFMFNGTSFGFVNCHLTSGNEKIARYLPQPYTHTLCVRLFFSGLHYILLCGDGITFLNPSYTLLFYLLFPVTHVTFDPYRRNQNYLDILRLLSLGDKQLSSFDISLRFTHLFWLGDLNYRLDMDIQVKLKIHTHIHRVMNHSRLG